MTTEILLLVTLLAYSMVVSQSFMYLISLKTVQLNLDANAYTQLRKRIDASMRANFKYVIYTALISTLLLVVLTARNPGSLLFVSSTLAFVALVLDVVIMMKEICPSTLSSIPGAPAMFPPTGQITATSGSNCLGIAKLPVS
ncbi:MAG: hypothetical protein IPH31_22960 [Lewinellaceae bacterium]|nr:hypothetical protein [Lewinellaceae bacterium]